MRVQELKERIDRYFAACDGTRERVEQKNGTVQYRQVPYTVQGLRRRAGWTRPRCSPSPKGTGRGAR